MTEEKASQEISSKICNKCKRSKTVSEFKTLRLGKDTKFCSDCRVKTRNYQYAYIHTTSDKKEDAPLLFMTLLKKVQMVLTDDRLLSEIDTLINVYEDKAIIRTNHKPIKHRKKKLEK